MADPGEEPEGGGGGPLILRPLPRFLRVWMTGRPLPLPGSSRSPPYWKARRPWGRSKLQVCSCQITITQTVLEFSHASVVLAVSPFLMHTRRQSYLPMPQRIENRRTVQIILFVMQFSEVMVLPAHMTIAITQWLIEC